jgi:hypothetical protein
LLIAQVAQVAGLYPDLVETLEAGCLGKILQLEDLIAQHAADAGEEQEEDAEDSPERAPLALHLIYEKAYCLPSIVWSLFTHTRSPPSPLRLLPHQST